MFINKIIHKPGSYLFSMQNKTLMNTIFNFTPTNKLVTLDDMDPMDEWLKGKIKWKNQFCKTYAKNG